MPTSEAKDSDHWVMRRAWVGVLLTGVLSLYALGAIWLDAVSGSYAPVQPSLFLSFAVLGTVWLLASAPNTPEGPSPWALQACATVMAFLAALLVTAILGDIWVIIASGSGGPYIGSTNISASSSAIAPFPGPIMVTGGTVASQPTSAQLSQVIMQLAGGFPAAIALWWIVCKLRELGDEVKGWIAGAIGFVLIVTLSFIAVKTPTTITPLPQPLPGFQQGQFQQGGSGGSIKILPPSSNSGTDNSSADNSGGGQVTPY